MARSAGSGGPRERHSRDMVAHRYFSHTSRSGLSSSGRIARTGWMREPASAGPSARTSPGTRRRPGARWVVRAWLRGPAHRHVLLNRRYRVAGLGVVARHTVRDAGQRRYTG